ncbi:MAG: transposase [Bacteroidota bacterium]
MSRILKINNPEGLYFVTFTIVHWIDLFTRVEYLDILIDSFNYCQANKGLRLHAFVFMPSHLHLIVSRTEGGEPLSGIIRDFKKHTSKELIKAIHNGRESRRNWLLRAFARAGKYNPNNKNYQVWQQDNHPVELITIKFIQQKLEYIHLNPVRARIVFNPIDYMHSSATAYAGRAVECPLNVELLELPLL